MKPDPGASRHIVLFAFDGVELLDVAGPLEAFATAAALLGGAAPGYTVEIAAERPGLLRTASGLAIAATRDFAAPGPLDTLLVAGGAAIEDCCARPALLDTLRRQAGRARRLGAVCTGAMLLAEAGLLDGRRAATHWNWCERLARRYPKVTVEDAPIFVEDGGVWTSAGVTAGIDLALAMIEDDFGAPLALRTARELVMFLRRPGGQSQFGLAPPAPSGRDEAIRRVRQAVVEHPEADLSVEALARLAAMSPRNFARVFKRDTGVAPAQFVERSRLEHARRRLESGAMPVELVALASGFRSADVMRRVFLRHLQVGPGDYRERFGAWRGRPPAVSPHPATTAEEKPQ